MARRSFNFTKSAEERNAELLILDSPERAKLHRAEWEKHRVPLGGGRKLRPGNV